jgi:hypothetical protein
MDLGKREKQGVKSLRAVAQRAFAKAIGPASLTLIDLLSLGFIQP